MSQSIHLCVEVEGLANLTKKEFNKCWNGVFKDKKTGKKCTYEEVVAKFTEELRLGHRVYPVCNCDNFDYQHGCRGHES